MVRSAAPDSAWHGCKELYAKANRGAKDLGRYEYVRSNRVACRLVLIKKRPAKPHKKRCLARRRKAGRAKSMLRDTLNLGCWQSLPIWRTAVPRRLSRCMAVECSGTGFLVKHVRRNALYSIFLDNYHHAGNSVNSLFIFPNMSSSISAENATVAFFSLPASVFLNSQERIFLPSFSRIVRKK